MSHDGEPAGATSFQFNQLVVQKVDFEVIERAPVAEGEVKTEPLQSTIEIKVIIHRHPERPEGLVSLDVRVLPDLRWQPYRIGVVVAGMFRSTGDSIDGFDEFCRMAVPSILFPYVRQIVQSVTTDAPFGIVRLNPINVHGLLASSWSDETPTPSIEP